MDNSEQPRVELIAIMGATGAGKSSFINHILQKGFKEAEVGHGQESCTADVTAMPFQLGNFRGSIIDTPGFDDTHLTDTQVLTKIANWMEATYRKGIKITGILYLRDITQARMSGTALKNLMMFRKLCGSDSLANVVIVTTKWDAVPAATGELREQELMSKFLGPMLALGAQQARHDNTALSAQQVLEKVLGNAGRPLKLQVQLVEEGKTLGETDAGAAVSEDIAKLRLKHDNELVEIKKALEEEKNEMVRGLLREEQKKLAEVEAKSEKDMKALEAHREKEMAEYERRLEEVAKLTGESTTSVLLKGLSTGVVAIGPVLLQQWQMWKQEQAREKEEQRSYEAELLEHQAQEKEKEREFQANLVKQQVEREEALENRKMEQARKLEAEARQREVEANQRKLEQEMATLRMENTTMRENATVRRPVGLFDILLFGL